jgi:hypothetical protein
MFFNKLLNSRYVPNSLHDTGYTYIEEEETQDTFVCEYVQHIPCFMVNDRQPMNAVVY